MHFPTKPSVVVRFWFDETVEAIRHNSIFDNNHTHTTHTGTIFVCCFKIYGCKDFHFLFCVSFEMQKYSIDLSFRVIGCFYLEILSPQKSFRLHLAQWFPCHTLSRWSAAASTKGGSFVSIPASKLRFSSPFIPIPAPVRLAEPM